VGVLLLKHDQNINLLLARFIPFAIFVCAVTLAIIPALLLFGIKKVNPITTRIELGCLGLAGIIWLALAAFLVSSDADDADVECYSSDAPGASLVEVPNFSTETFQAQFRVLEAFSLFNVILIWGFLLFLLFLAFRHHRNGARDVWHTPVTAYSWFYRYQTEENQKLPPPVTAPVDRSKSKGAGALTEVPEKSRDRRAKAAREQQGQQPRNGYKHGYWLPQQQQKGAPPVPPKSGGEAGRTRATRSTRDRHDRTGDKFQRDASPRR